MIKIECDACSATGLYCGFAEPKGTAVICHGCSGTGCLEVNNAYNYTPFTGRKCKQGVQRVLGDGGLWMTRTGNEKTIPVEQFYQHDPSLNDKSKEW